MKVIVRTAIASGDDEGPNHETATAAFRAAVVSLTHLRQQEMELSAQHPELKPHLEAIVGDFAHFATEIIKKAATDGTEEMPSDDED